MSYYDSYHNMDKIWFRFSKPEEYLADKHTMTINEDGHLVKELYSNKGFAIFKPDDKYNFFLSCNTNIDSFVINQLSDILSDLKTEMLFYKIKRCVRNAGEPSQNIKLIYDEKHNVFEIRCNYYNRTLLSIFDVNSNSYDNNNSVKLNYDNTKIYAASQDSITKKDVEYIKSVAINWITGC